MIKSMLFFIFAGFGAGYFDLIDIPEAIGSTAIMVLLCFMMFVASIEMGKLGFIKDLREAGLRIATYALATVAGTLVSAWAFAPLLSISGKDALVTASGMGWYSLAAGLVFEYSPPLSIATFVYCLFRELGAIFLMPVLWKRFQVPELVSLAGSAAMNPAVAATAVTGDQAFIFYGMISGSIVSMFVPVLVPLMISL